MKMFINCLFLLVFLLVLASCGDKGAYNKTMYKKNKPSRVIREDHLKHQKKVNRRMERMYRKHHLRTRG